MVTQLPPTRCALSPYSVVGCRTLGGQGWQLVWPDNDCWLENITELALVTQW